MTNSVTKFSPVHSRFLGPTGLGTCLRPRKTLANDIGKAICTTGICKADGLPYVKRVKMAKMHYRYLWSGLAEKG